MASMSRVSCGGFSAGVSPTGLDDSFLACSRSKLARLRFMMIKPPTREPNITVFRIAVVEEYTI
jgi:hypothetical protein